MEFARIIIISVGDFQPCSFHSFNYNQWGTGIGKVVELSNNVVNINNQTYFRVRCSLDQSFLSLKNGYKGYLKKGMTLTGRFMVTKRSLFQLLYDKTDNYWKRAAITSCGRPKEGITRCGRNSCQRLL